MSPAFVLFAIILDNPVEAAVVYLLACPNVDEGVIMEEYAVDDDDAVCIWLDFDFDLYADFNSNCNSSHLTVSSAAFVK